MSAAVDALVASVTKLKSVDESVIAFIQGLAAQIAAVAGDQAATLQLSQDVSDQADALSAAITANTPADKKR